MKKLINILLSVIALCAAGYTLIQDRPGIIGLLITWLCVFGLIDLNTDWVDEWCRPFEEDED